MKQTFKKAERLSGEKAIDGLFKNGRSFTVSPYKVMWMEAQADQPVPVQIAFSVPKRNFKRAVDRNKLKRRSREAYRKNKDKLYKAIGDKKVIVMLIYLVKEINEYAILETKINLLIDRLSKEVNEGGK